MGERFHSSKEALRKAIDVLEERSWGDLNEEEVRGLLARILSTRETLIQNEKKIWLKTKKGKEMLAEMDVVADGLLRSIVKLREESYNSHQDFIGAFEKM